MDKENRKYTQRLFQFFTTSIRPLRVEELAEILVVQFDATVSPKFNEDGRRNGVAHMLQSHHDHRIQIVTICHFYVKPFWHQTPL